MDQSAEVLRDCDPFTTQWTPRNVASFTDGSLFISRRIVYLAFAPLFEMEMNRDKFITESMILVVSSFDRCYRLKNSKVAGHAVGSITIRI
jgi:hypothetical protein